MGKASPYTVGRLSVAALIGAMSVASPTGFSESAASTNSMTAVSARSADEPHWHWPVGLPWQVLHPFEAPENKYSSGHRGVDLRSTPGETVVAPADGVVHFAGYVVDRPVVTLEHPDDLLASFEPVVASVTKGTAVRKGDPIGIVGAGGHCADACIHFGVRYQGEYISPMLFLGHVPRAVLLPLGDHARG
jgi:murein DD-endopeptidase MepM/ murein hydrolase activator NlpD